MTANPIIEKPEAVYFYGTCLMDLWAPDAGLAAIRLLQREGVSVIFPPQQTCCGQPAYNSGFRKEAKAVAAKQIPLFSKEIPIVVPSSSCAAMMQHHYPVLFAGDEMEEEARRFASRVYEFTWFLVHVLKLKLIDYGPPTTVTWHASCHALRGLGIKEEPIQLLEQLSNVTVNRLQRENECCGFGGTFAVKHPEISGAMVSDKAEDVLKSGAEKLLGGDCGCLMNISGHLEYRGATMSTAHLADFLWERSQP